MTTLQDMLDNLVKEQIDKGFEPDPTVMTFTHGEPVDPWNIPSDYVFDIKDIARGLSRLNRYGGAGHTHLPLDVATHSMAVSEVFDDPATRLVALLHDAAEFMFQDLNPLIKKHLPEYKKKEEEVQLRIYTQFLPAAVLADLPHLRGVVGRVDKKVMPYLEMPMLFIQSSEDVRLFSVPHEHFCDGVTNEGVERAIVLLDTSLSRPSSCTCKLEDTFETAYTDMITEAARKHPSVDETHQSN